MANPESRLGHAGQDDLHPHAQHAMPDAAQEYEAHVVVDGGTIATTTAATQFGIYATIVLAPSGVVMVLPQDPNRQYAYITAVDQPVVLSTQKEAAQSPANQAAAVPNPQGAYLAAGSTTPAIRHNESVYAANTSTTTATRVSVLVERGTPG